MMRSVLIAWLFSYLNGALGKLTKFAGALGELTKFAGALGELTKFAGVRSLH